MPRRNTKKTNPLLRKVTVRVPQAVDDALVAQAAAEGLAINAVYIRTLEAGLAKYQRVCADFAPKAGPDDRS
jgi:predicted HicB family RNase H-like nuclease